MPEMATTIQSSSSSSSKRRRRTATTRQYVLLLLLLVTCILLPVSGQQQQQQQQQYYILKTFTGHTHWVHSVTWSPDGKLVASGSDDNTVRIWNASPDVATTTTTTATTTTTTNNGTTTTTAIPTTTSSFLMQTLDEHSNDVRSVAWMPAMPSSTSTTPSSSTSTLSSTYTDLLASASDDDTIRLWNVTAGESIQILKGHNHNVETVAWSPHMIPFDDDDNNNNNNNNTTATTTTAVPFLVVASGGQDATVRIWNARTGQALAVLTGHLGWVYSVAWSPDGTQLASAGTDDTIRLWNVRWNNNNNNDNDTMLLNVTPAAALMHPSGTDGRSKDLTSVAWSPDGRLLAAGSWDDTISIWNAQTGEFLRSLQGHSSEVYSVAWKPATSNDDNNDESTTTTRTSAHILASGCGDETIRIWDADTGETLSVLTGHSGSVYSVAWSPDGQQLASGSSDDTIRIWGTTVPLVPPPTDPATRPTPSFPVDNTPTDPVPTIPPVMPEDDTTVDNALVGVIVGLVTALVLVSALTVYIVVRSRNKHTSSGSTADGAGGAGAGGTTAATAAAGPPSADTMVPEHLEVNV